MVMEAFTRRDFLKGSAVGAVSVAGLGALAGCAPKSADSAAGSAAEGGMTFADTIAWDGEYDVVVVGFGAAGAVSACFAAEAGAKVLLIDKAPFGSEGGNSRFCGQIIQHSADKDAMVRYFKGMASDYEVDDEVAEVFAEGLTKTRDTLKDYFGVAEEDFHNWKTDQGPSKAISLFIPEYPEIEGGEALEILTVSHATNNSALWKTYRRKVMELSDHIDVWYASPATKLYQDPVSKAIIGVAVEKESKKLNVRALNGVVLSLGGFENNPQMVETFLGITKSAASGTLFNTGDGIKLALGVGADLWHMDAFEGNCFALGGVSFVVEPNRHANSLNDMRNLSGSVIAVGTNGERYLREDVNARHGHMPHNGDWISPKRPRHTYIVYDQAQSELIAQYRGIPDEFADQIVSADTIGELESKLNMQAGMLERTIAEFNEAASTGNDPCFHRPAESMRAFSDAGPYYAIEVVQSFLNTQGGARRNSRAEVVGVDGNPIGHLYSAGEFGGITAYQYNGGGNMAECLIFGQIAGTNAAAPKDPLPALPLNVASEIEYTQGSGSNMADPDPSQILLGEGEYLGTSQLCMGNELAVKVKMENGKIASVEVVQQQETAGIGSKAVEALPAIIVEAQSTDVDAVSGATLSSKAIKEAVEKAIAQAS